MASPQTINAFLKQYLEDQSSGQRRTLDQYVVMFPGDDAGVAEQYAEMESEAFDRAAVSVERYGPYRVLEELGRGGQGVVYLAEDERLHRTVALKVLTGLGSLETNRVARFLREAEVASRLDHPGIATVYEIGTHAGVPYIAMRYVEGDTLAGRIVNAKASEGSVGTVAEVALLAEKAARALHAAHEAGVIHRDVKPGNILIPVSSDPVIVDFGLAHDAEGSSATITKTGEFFGTPAYMSPEQITNQKIAPDRRTDVWSLGVTLYECLALERPFEAPTREHLYRAILSREPRDVRRINRRVPEDLAAIVETALQKEVDRRYQTAGAMADDLEAFLEGRPVSARRIGPLGGLLRWARREPMKAALGLVALIALPVIAALVTDHVANRENVEFARLARIQDDKDEMLSQGYYELGEGSVDHALGCFERARSMEGGSPEAVVGIALAHLKLEQPSAALGTLDANGDAVRGLRAAVMLRARAVAALGRKGEADSLERGAPPPRDAVDSYLEGERLIEEGHGGRSAGFQEALDSFRMAIYFSTKPRAICFQGAAHAAGHLKDRVAAREMAQSLKRHWPRSASCAYWAGYAFTVVSTDDAITAYQEAIALRPKYPVALMNLGIQLTNNRRYEEAVAALRAAVALEPTSFSAHYDLAKALKHQGLIDEAIASFREAVRLKPGESIAHNNLGIALRDRGLIDEAIASYREAIRLKPGYALAHSNLAVALDQKGRRDEAIVSFREAIRLKPDLGDAHGNFCDTLRAKGLTDEAIAEGREAVRLQPGIAAWRRNLGMALEDGGLLDDAIASYREAVRIRPEYAETHCDLGIALAKTGRLAEGLESVRRGHDLGSRKAGWSYPSAKCVEDVEDLVRREQRMLEIAAGKDQPAGASEIVALADVAFLTHRWQLAAAWYEAALDSDAALANEDHRGLRAAEAAIQTASSGGAESRESPDGPRLRKRALSWLERELMDYREGMQDGGADADRLRRDLGRWLTDPLLAPVRDEAPMSQLPPDEAQAWTSLWHGVRQTIAAR